MNITMATDKEVIEGTCECAYRQGLSLSELFRRYMESALPPMDLERSAEEFARNALAGFAPP